LNGIAISFVNYTDELPFFRDEVLPRLERLGLRTPHRRPMSPPTPSRARIYRRPPRSPPAACCVCRSRRSRGDSRRNDSADVSAVITYANDLGYFKDAARRGDLALSKRTGHRAAVIGGTLDVGAANIASIAARANAVCC